MNTHELKSSLRKLRISGMAETLEMRLTQAQAEELTHADFFGHLIEDELTRRHDRLVARRVKQAAFRDAGRTLDSFDFSFNKKTNKKLVFELAAGHYIGRSEDVLFLGSPGTGKSHLAQALGLAAILQGHRVLYRQAYELIEEIAEAELDDMRAEKVAELSTVPLLIIDDLGMRKLPQRAAEDLLEIVMRRYERTSTMLTSNRPVEDWGQLLGDNAATSAMLDRLLHHGHVLKCGPKSYRTHAVG